MYELGSMPAERWILHEPADEGELSGVLLVLWHGAGGDIDQPHLVSLAGAVAAHGGHAARARFEYRAREKRAPDRMPKLIESARETIAMLSERIEERRLYLGGRSMGGRAASMLVAEGHRADGLVFLSYPLHPARQKTKLRDAHLESIRAPMLFMSGDRDPLADLELLRKVTAKLGDRATLQIWPGDHSLKKLDPARVDEVVIRWLTTGAASAA